MSKTKIEIPSKKKLLKKLNRDGGKKLTAYCYNVSVPTLSRWMAHHNIKISSKTIICTYD